MDPLKGTGKPPKSLDCGLRAVAPDGGHPFLWWPAGGGMQAAANWPPQGPSPDLDHGGLSVPPGWSRHPLPTASHLERETPKSCLGSSLGRPQGQIQCWEGCRYQLPSLDLLPNKAHIQSRKTQAGSKTTCSSNSFKPAPLLAMVCFLVVVLKFCYLVNSAVTLLHGCETPYSVPSKH